MVQRRGGLFLQFVAALSGRGRSAGALEKRGDSFLFQRVAQPPRLRPSKAGNWYSCYLHSQFMPKYGLAEDEEAVHDCN
jgi:hypothetical protein